MVLSRLTATSASWVQAILLSPPPEELGLQACITIPSYFFFFFVFLVETGFHHVFQAGLERLTLLLTHLDQSAGITDVSRHAGHFFFNYTEDF